MHHRNSGWVEPAAHDQPQPLRPEIGWQVRWLRRGQVRIVGATSPSGVAFQLPPAACRNRLQHGRQIRVRAKALGENSEAVAAYTGALAAGEAHHDVGILPQAPVRDHANSGGFTGSEDDVLGRPWTAVLELCREPPSRPRGRLAMAYSPGSSSPMKDGSRKSLSRARSAAIARHGGWL